MLSLQESHYLFNYSNPSLCFKQLYLLKPNLLKFSFLLNSTLISSFTIVHSFILVKAFIAIVAFKH